MSSWDWRRPWKSIYSQQIGLKYFRLFSTPLLTTYYLLIVYLSSFWCFGRFYITLYEVNWTTLPFGLKVVSLQIVPRASYVRGRVFSSTSVWELKMDRMEKIDCSILPSKEFWIKEMLGPSRFKPRMVQLCCFAWIMSYHKVFFFSAKALSTDCHFLS